MNGFSNERSGLDFYILDGHKVVNIGNDPIRWGIFFNEIENRRVKETSLTNPKGEKIQISTVFLGIDHSFLDGSPLLFETMVFVNDDMSGEYQERCTTWDEAVVMHERAVYWAKEHLGGKGDGSQSS